MFDITVFVNSMNMHFPNNLYMLFMMMPNVKKMYYILYVQRLKINHFLCFKMTSGLTVNITQSWSSFHMKSFHSIWVHLAFLWKQHELQSVWSLGKPNGLSTYVCLVSWAMEYEVFWSSEKLWGVNFQYPTQQPMVVPAFSMIIGRGLSFF